MPVVADREYHSIFPSEGGGDGLGLTGLDRAGLDVLPPGPAFSSESAWVMVPVFLTVMVTLPALTDASSA